MKKSKHSKMKYRVLWVQLSNKRAERRVPVWATGKRNTMTYGRKGGFNVEYS